MPWPGTQGFPRFLFVGGGEMVSRVEGIKRPVRPVKNIYRPIQIFTLDAKLKGGFPSPPPQKKKNEEFN